MTDKLSTDIREFLERTATKTFLSSARQFVDLLETENIDKVIFYSKAHTALLDLYTAGHKLDLIDLKYSSADSDFDRETIFEIGRAHV